MVLHNGPKPPTLKQNGKGKERMDATPKPKQRKGARQAKNQNAINKQLSDMSARQAGAQDSLKELRDEIAQLKAEIAQQEAAEAKRIRELNQQAHENSMEYLVEKLGNKKWVEDEEYSFVNSLCILWVLIGISLFLTEPSWDFIGLLGFCIIMLILPIMWVILYVLCLPLRWGCGKAGFEIGDGYCESLFAMCQAYSCTLIPCLVMRHTQTYRTVDFGRTDLAFDTSGPDLRLNSVHHVKIKSPECRGKYTLYRGRVDEFRIFGTTIYRHAYPVLRSSWKYSNTLLAELSTVENCGLDLDYEVFRARCQAKMKNELSVNIDKYRAAIDDVYKGTFILASIIWKDNASRYETLDF